LDEHCHRLSYIKYDSYDPFPLLRKSIPLGSKYYEAPTPKSNIYFPELFPDIISQDDFKVKIYTPHIYYIPYKADDLQDLYNLCHHHNYLFHIISGAPLQPLKQIIYPTVANLLFWHKVATFHTPFDFYTIHGDAHSMLHHDFHDPRNHFIKFFEAGNYYFEGFDW